MVRQLITCAGNTLQHMVNGLQSFGLFEWHNCHRVCKRSLHAQIHVADFKQGATDELNVKRRLTNVEGDI